MADATKIDKQGININARKTSRYNYKPDQKFILKS